MRPFVWCQNVPNQKAYRGFQIDTARSVFHNLGWGEDDYFFTCMPWDAMMADLLDEKGNCYMAAAGVEISVENMQQGIQFSSPIYKSGLTVLVKATLDLGTRWGFLQAFHWSLWLVLFLTGGVVSFLVVMLEKFTRKSKKYRTAGWQHWSWVTWAQLVQLQVDVGMPRTWQARVIFIVYGFTILVMMAMLTATTAARMTKPRMKSNIHNRHGLYDKKVETSEGYTSLLKRYNIYADGFTWHNIEDEERMVQRLRDGKYDALVIDAPWAKFTVANAPKCDLMTTGDFFNPWSLAFAFAKNFPDALIHQLSEKVVYLEEIEGLFEELELTYIQNRGSCSRSDEVDVDVQIGMKQVAGLWIVMSAVIGFVLLSFLYHIYSQHRKRKSKVSQHPGMQPRMSLRELVSVLMEDENNPGEHLHQPTEQPGGPSPAQPSTEQVTSQGAADGGNLRANFGSISSRAQQSSWPGIGTAITAQDDAIRRNIQLLRTATKLARHSKSLNLDSDSDDSDDWSDEPVPKSRSLQPSTSILGQGIGKLFQFRSFNRKEKTALLSKQRALPDAVDPQVCTVAVDGQKTSDTSKGSDEEKHAEASEDSEVQPFSWVKTSPPSTSLPLAPPSAHSSSWMKRSAPSVSALAVTANVGVSAETLVTVHPKADSTTVKSVAFLDDAPTATITGNQLASHGDVISAPARGDIFAMTVVPDSNTSSNIAPLIQQESFADIDAEIYKLMK